MTVTFANETASGSRDAWFAVVTGISGVVALASFAILLLIFPYDYLAASRARKQAGARARHLLIMMYIWVHLACALLIATYVVAKDILAFQPQTLLGLLVYFYFFFALAFLLFTIISSYFLS